MAASLSWGRDTNALVTRSSPAVYADDRSTDNLHFLTGYLDGRKDG
jgi:hypothetical protein